MRILFLTENEVGASTRYRIRQYLPTLEARGVSFELQAVPSSRGERRALFLGAGAFDRVVLQRRLVHPFDFRVLRRYAAHLTLDVDDAVQFPDSTSGKRRSFTRWIRFFAAASAADQLILGNAVLEEYAKTLNSRTVVVPTVVDASAYPKPAARDASVRPLRLVWIGSRSTLPFLEDVLPALDPLVEEGVVGTLRVIADAAPSIATRVPIEPVPWSAETEAASLAEADVGLSPLRDDRWCRGKCGLRLLQYFAASVPAVAAPVGVQGDVIADGCGIAASTADEIRQALRELHADPSRREAIATAARARLEKSYDLGVWRDRFADLVTGRATNEEGREAGGESE